MKTTLLLYSTIILSIGSISAHAQPARPQKRSPVIIIPYVPQKITIASNADSQTPPSLPISSNNIVVNSHISLSSGMILLNPYNLTTNGLSGAINGRRALDKGSGTQAKFFIDLAVNYVWAWDSDRRARFAEEYKDKDESHWFWRGTMPVDIQTHISYYAKDNSKTTASAIVGSGSFGGEVNLGFPIYRALYTTDGSFPRPANKKHYTPAESSDLYDNTESAHWFGVVGSYSGVTDSDSFSVRNRYLLGFGYRAAYPSLKLSQNDKDNKDDTKPREFVLSVTIGAAGVDTVQFLNNTREIKMHHGDVPAYALQPTFALEMEAYYPINSNLSAVLGSRIYPNSDPGMWSAFVGLTIPMDKVAGVFGGD